MTNISKSDITKSKILVTGATGFIGRRLARRLVEAGAQVWTTGLPGEQPPSGVASHSPLDARDGDAVRAIVAEAAPQIVFHLAAAGVTDSGVDAALALAVNVGGALHLLEALRGRDARRVVLAGTCYEYGAREAVEGLDPFNAYAASKVAAWAFGRMYWRMYGLPVVTVRPFQVYGPGQPTRTLIPAAIRAALAGEDFPMTPGQQQRDFIYVDDVVDGMLAAAAAPHLDGESLDLGTGRAHAILRVVERIWTMMEAPGKILAGRLPYRTGAVMRLVAGADRTAHLTGWRARVGLEEGLRRTIEMVGSFADE
ncbi:MAG: NAD(P)-dependent oxidoreductase [Chloroflexota bacterium]|nr:NAD(P)-dependent oxidoreductase [Chloroflexota bacterium]